MTTQISLTEVLADQRLWRKVDGIPEVDGFPQRLQNFIKAEDAVYVAELMSLSRQRVKQEPNLGIVAVNLLDRLLVGAAGRGLETEVMDDSGRMMDYGVLREILDAASAGDFASVEKLVDGLGATARSTLTALQGARLKANELNA